jgi:hypothetical protein
MPGPPGAKWAEAEVVETPSEPAEMRAAAALAMRVLVIMAVILVCGLPVSDFATIA